MVAAFPELPKGDVPVRGEASLTVTSARVPPPQPRVPTVLCPGEALSVVRDTRGCGTLSQQAFQAGARATRVGNYQNVPKAQRPMVSAGLPSLGLKDKGPSLSLC